MLKPLFLLLCLFFNSSFAAGMDEAGAGNPLYDALMTAGRQMKANPANLPAEWHALKDIWNTFDPIGVFHGMGESPFGPAGDEYEDYVGATLKILGEPCPNTLAKVTGFITYVCDEYMGLHGIVVAEGWYPSVAEQIMDWHSRRKPVADVKDAIETIRASLGIY